MDGGRVSPTLQDDEGQALDHQDHPPRDGQREGQEFNAPEHQGVCLFGLKALNWIEFCFCCPPEAACEEARHIEQLQRVLRGLERGFLARLHGCGDTELSLAEHDGDLQQGLATLHREANRPFRSQDAPVQLLKAVDLGSVDPDHQIAVEDTGSCCSHPLADFDSRNDDFIREGQEEEGKEKEEEGATQSGGTGEYLYGPAHCRVEGHQRPDGAFDLQQTPHQALSKAAHAEQEWNEKNGDAPNHESPLLIVNHKASSRHSDSDRFDKSPIIPSLSRDALVLERSDSVCVEVSWAASTSPVTINLNALWGSAANNVYAAGQSGTVVRWNGTAWATVTVGTTTSDFLCLWGSAANNVWVAGAGGATLQFDGTTWINRITASQSVGALWGTGPADVFAFATGRLRHWDGTAWTVVRTTVLVSYSAAWGSSGSDIWTAWGNGLLRFDGVSWYAADALDSVPSGHPGLVSHRRLGGRLRRRRASLEWNSPAHPPVQAPR